MPGLLPPAPRPLEKRAALPAVPDYLPLLSARRRDGDRRGLDPLPRWTRSAPRLDEVMGKDLKPLSFVDPNLQRARRSAAQAKRGELELRSTKMIQGAGHAVLVELFPIDVQLGDCSHEPRRLVNWREDLPLLAQQGFGYGVAVKHQRRELDGRERVKVGSYARDHLAQRTRKQQIKVLGHRHVDDAKGVHRLSG